MGPYHMRTCLWAPLVYFTSLSLISIVILIIKAEHLIFTVAKGLWWLEHGFSIALAKFLSKEIDCVYTW